IVGEHVQGHLGGNLWQALHQKVRRTHPHLERTEGMLDCLAAHAHRLRVLIETLLHRFEHVLVFPSRDSSLGSCRTPGFERAARTCRRPVAAQRFAMKDRRGALYLAVRLDRTGDEITLDEVERITI